MAALDHFERGKHLLAEHVLARRHKSLGAQHLEGVVRDVGVAEAGFASPDRQHYAGRNAEASLDGPERLAELRGTAAPATGDTRDDVLGEIIARRAELGLMLHLRRLRGLTRHHEVRQLEVRAHAVERRVEGLLRHAPRAGIRPQIVLQPCLELRRHVLRGCCNRSNKR